MNNAKRKATKRFKKIKRIKISRFVATATKEEKIAVAKKILGLQPHEGLEDHRLYGWKPRYAPVCNPTIPSQD